MGDHYGDSIGHEPRVTTRGSIVLRTGLTSVTAHRVVPASWSNDPFLTCLSRAQGMNSRTNTPVETWKGPKGKQSYTYIIEENATVSFTWAFQRTTLHKTVSPSPSQGQTVCTGGILV